MIKKYIPPDIADVLLEHGPPETVPHLSAMPAATPSSEAASEVPDIDLDDEFVQDIVAALKTIYDPEIPVNIYDLGLIYRVKADSETRVVHVQMTLTTPGCPVAQTFPGTIEGTLLMLPNVKQAEVEVVWEPPWTMERMSEAAKLQLGML